MSLSNAVGPVLWNVDARGVATVTLNRPEVNNAYNGELLQGLLAALDALGGAHGLRAVVIKGNGKHFQAGADLKWIDAVRTASAAENVRVSRATAEAVARLNHVPVPTVALVQGGCFGGGTGGARAGGSPARRARRRCACGGGARGGWSRRPPWCTSDCAATGPGLWG